MLKIVLILFGSLFANGIPTGVITGQHHPAMVVPVPVFRVNHVAHHHHVASGINPGRIPSSPLIPMGPLVSKPLVSSGPLMHSGPLTPRPLISSGPLTHTPLISSGPLTHRPLVSSGPLTNKPLHSAGPLFSMGPLRSSGPLHAGAIAHKPLISSGRSEPIAGEFSSVVHQPGIWERETVSVQRTPIEPVLVRQGYAVLY